MLHFKVEYFSGADYIKYLLKNESVFENQPIFSER
jgi:hypothetical protein